MRLGDILVEQGLISEGVRDEAIKALSDSATDGRLGEWLIAEGYCNETGIVRTLALLYGLPFAETIPDGYLDPALVHRLPVDWARDRHVLPIRYEGRLAVVTADPARVQDVDDLSLLLAEEAELVLAPSTEIARAIEACYYSKENETDALLETLKSDDTIRQPADQGVEDLLRMADNAPVSQLVNSILLDALRSGASDIHIEPYHETLRTRFRIDGILYERASPPKHLEASLVSRLKVMAHLDIAERRMPQDGAARIRIGEREIDIRMSTVPVSDGERIVLRLLNRDATVLPLANLGLDSAMRGRMQDLLKEPYGVIWVTGPTGSGKTTTLYAALQELDCKRLNVITIEDPVEYQLPTISQISINPKIGLTFARGLRHILRQDPDVILVGETRDMETAEIVVRSSLTGHLVFSTLHTNDAVSAPIRLMDMGVEPYLVAASLRATLAQRLVRQLCPLCRRPTETTEEQRNTLGARAHRLAGKELFTANGCDACLEGYKGRLGLFELVEADTEIQEIIRQGGDASALRHVASSRGMRTLLEDGLDKVLAGATSLDEVLRVVGPGADADI